MPVCGCIHTPVLGHQLLPRVCLSIPPAGACQGVSLFPSLLPICSVFPLSSVTLLGSEKLLLRPGCLKKLGMCSVLGVHQTWGHIPAPPFPRHVGDLEPVQSLLSGPQSPPL